MLRHQPVLLSQVLDAIPAHTSRIMDGTLGHAGHTQAMLDKFSHEQKDIYIIGVDRDNQMISKAEQFLTPYIGQYQILQGSYAEMERIYIESGSIPFDFILLDIGVNMDHFKVASRGFSIKMDGELDMRFDTTKGKTASQRLSTVKEKAFIEALEKYTDFRPVYISNFIREFYRSKRIYTTTKTFVHRLKETLEMNDKVIAVLFQAIRISVNGELDELQQYLNNFSKYLAVGGRCCILTYHSIEDRITKQGFQSLVQTGNFCLINKHVITPTRTEQQENRASRSAKMRVIERIK